MQGTEYSYKASYTTDELTLAVIRSLSSRFDLVKEEYRKESYINGLSSLTNE